MSRKLLVAYGTKSGSTVDVAECIGKHLAPHFADVDVRSTALLGHISSYDAVIVGSPILEGHFAPGVLEFLIRNRNVLSQVPTAYFFTCMIVTRVSEISSDGKTIFVDPALRLTRSTEKSHALAQYLLPLVEYVPEVKPVSIAFFKGRLDMKKLDFFTRMTMRFITLLTSEIQEGDFLDWEVIQNWATLIQPSLVK